MRTGNYATQLTNFKSMRYFNFIFSFFLLALLISCSANQKAGIAEVPPNIIIILADGPGYSDIGHFGSEIRTPNLDMISEKGLVLTQFYNTGSFHSSSASLLTGLYPQFMNKESSDLQYETGQDSFNCNCITLPEIFKAKGYSTFISRFSPNDVKDTCKNSSIYFSDKAVEFIRASSADTTPFFMYIPFSISNMNFQVTPEDIKNYPDTYSEGWDKIREERYRKMMMNGIMGMDENLSPLPADINEWNTYSPDERNYWVKQMIIYAAVIENMDKGVGELLKVLNDTQKDENTLIIFVSVNSECNNKFANIDRMVRTDSAINIPPDSLNFSDDFVNITNSPFGSCNQLAHEGGISSPFIAYWPKRIDSGNTNSMPFHIIDIYPTVLSASGILIPSNITLEKGISQEGISFSPLFSGEEPDEHEFLIWEVNGSRALRIGDYKIVSDSRDGDWEIYDILNDRCELEELSEDSPQEMKNMKKIFKTQSKRLGLTD